MWPAIVVAALIIFRHPLRRIIASAERREWTLEVGGQKLTMRQLSEQQNSLITDLQRQVGGLSHAVAGRAPDRAPAADAGRDAGPAGPAGQAARQGWEAADLPADAPANSVLWVDDHPENNAVLIESLRRSGARVDLARTTRDGLALLSQRRYAIVISDMGRSEEGQDVPDAGLRLLKRVRETRPALPFVIYASPGASSYYREQALAEHATAITASPTELSAILLALGLG
jgi:CheY-like chemotaxis protein